MPCCRRFSAPDVIVYTLCAMRHVDALYAMRRVRQRARCYYYDTPLFRVTPLMLLRAPARSKSARDEYAVKRLLVCASAKTRRRLIDDATACAIFAIAYADVYVCRYADCSYAVYFAPYVVMLRRVTRERRRLSH